MDSEQPSNEWMTTAEVAAKFGLTEGSVRTNFPRRYKIRPINDMWRRSEILRVDLARSKKAA